VSARSHAADSGNGPASAAAPVAGVLRQRPTLTRRLLVWVLSAQLLVWACYVVVGFSTGIHEAEEVTDGHLASVAALLLNEKHPEFVAPDLATSRVQLPQLKSHDYQQTLSIVYWDAAGRQFGTFGQAPFPPFDQHTGFADLQLGTPPAPWRSFSQWDVSHSRKVTVLVKLAERDDLAFDIAQQIIEPGLWLLPAVTLALALAIWRGLRPLYELSDEVARLDVNRSERLPLRHGLREFDSVVASINTLIARQAAALDRERQLASEMAHELRTPLSSISLQAKALSSPLAPQEREQALAQIEGDALRAGHVLAQLLALARASRAELQQARDQVELPTLARQLVADYAQAAWRSGHQLAVSGADDLRVEGHPLLLELALRNLVENALHHTPDGTVVEVQVDRNADQVWLQVLDDGAGRSGDAPVLGKGSADRLGLGHMIVRRVADLHGGSFDQPAAPAPFTTCFRLVLPRSPLRPER